MSIVAMKKLKLIAVQSQKEEILKDLMLLGCVQIEEPEVGDDENRPVIMKSTKIQDLTLQQSTISNALARLNKYSPYSQGLLSPLPEVELKEILNESALEEDMVIAQRILDNDAAIRSISASENRERNTIASMAPWLSMNQDLSQKGTVYTDIMYGSMPISESLQNAVDAIADLDAEISVVSEDKQYRFISVIYFKGLLEDVTTALKNVGFVPVIMTDQVGTPKEVVSKAEQSIEALAKEKQSIVDAIVAEAANRQRLQIGLETLQTMIGKEEASSKLALTKSTFFMEGWLTAPEEKKLEEVLGKYTCAWETENPSEDEVSKVPIKLKNNKVTAPYNVVTEMYSLPAYNGLDPNPFIMPFFALFFGMMFADMAYGIILLLAGIVWKKKAKPKGTMGYMSGLLIECGISTFILGFLTGGFFGDAVSVVGSWFGKSIQIVPDFAHFAIAGNEVTLPLNLTTGNNPLYVLVFAILLGVIHLLLGTIIGCYLKFKDGQYIDAIFNDFSWWIIIAGLVVMLLNGNKVCLIVGLAMMVLGSLITNKGFGKISGILTAVYNQATGYLGDLLSYSRLMALMLAGSVIASVFNKLGSLGNANGPTIFGTILFIVVFLIGHVLNFLLNVIGCFVHTLRLQYLEFFGKWYRDGGKAFKPLQIKTKNFDVISKEEQ